jgi:hypothetical protein
MLRIRSCGNTATELRLIEIFKRHGIAGWRRKQALGGKPDFFSQGISLCVCGRLLLARLPGTRCVAQAERSVLAGEDLSKSGPLRESDTGTSSYRMGGASHLGAQPQEAGTGDHPNPKGTGRSTHQACHS